MKTIGSLDEKEAVTIDNLRKFLDNGKFLARVEFRICRLRKGRARSGG